MSGTANKAPPARERVLTTEEAALRHVALLVARGSATPEIFDAVAEQVARIFGRPWAGVMRYDSAETFVVVATSGEHHFSVGSRWPLDGPSVFEAVLRTGLTAAVFDYAGLPGTVAHAAQQAGIVGGVGAPIIVDGQTWGVIAVPATREAPIPPGVETRLSVFAELAATAIANADARASLALLVDEQAALRRVATLVAREASPAEIFVAVTEEACRVLASEAVGLLRFDPDETAVLVAQSDTPWPPPPLGTRFPLDGDNLVTSLFRTGVAARVDDWTAATGAVAAMASVLGVRSAVASPVVVEGRVWGTIIAATSQVEPLPPDMEARLAQFTGLVATGIASAQARGDVSRLAEEQAALRRVALLVAQQPSSVQVFAAVTEAVAVLLGADLAAMHVFRDDGMATVVASWSQAGPTLPIGTELPLGGDSAVARIFHTGAAARIDGYADAEGEAADVARGLRLRSAVGAPILVEGRLWGALMAAALGEEPLPEDAEARIAAFTELVATAVSNAQAREDVERLADEQAALRRIAVLVAQQPSPTEVFSAVSEAVGSVLGADVTGMVMCSDDVTATLVAGWSREAAPVPVGMRLPLDKDGVTARVVHSAAPARVDDTGPGASSELAGTLGVSSSVAAPIVVGGKLWGVLGASVCGDQPLPADAEARIAAFTELVATAVSNAQAREDLQRLADEQAALRRVATLVARGVGPEGVFGAVAAEVGVLFGADVAAIVRFEADGTATVLGDVGGPHVSGKRVELDEGYVVHGVRETGRPARFDTDDPSTADMPSLVRGLGIRSSVASPVIVEGELWGATTAASVEGPLPLSAERRLTEFTELVAAAVANTQAHEHVTALADEQAALRRIATLVAGGAPPEQVFAAVTDEIAATFDAVTAVMRYEHDPPGKVMVGISEEGGIPIGTRWPLGEGVLSTEVYRTGRSARIGAVEHIHGRPAAGFRFGVPSQVACPIVVEGSLWGVITLNAADELPPDTEQRLEKFTALVTTAIANTEARIALQTGAEEQGALRRVATLVASSAEPSDVFAAVTREIALVLGADASLLCRADPDGSAVIVGTWAESAPEPPLGTRMRQGGKNLTTIVLETGRPARIESYAGTSGDASEVARAHGLRSAVGAPILVEGHLWGLVIVGTTGEDALPADAEERLAGFTELVATAISNADARVAVRAAADEQAALRRVATLVAASAPPSEVFAAVTREVAHVLGADASLLCRADGDSAVVVGTWANNAPAAPPGFRIPRGGTNLTTIVLDTGRPARIDNYADATGDAADVAHSQGVRSAVGAPILVEGRLWGLVVVGASGDEPLPPDAEKQLAAFTELVATAISNATARAELVASRARIVAAGDEARRRIERNLHDGAQQRLLALGLDLQRARAAIPDDQVETRSALAGAEQDLEAILTDLREVSHGLHPQLLSRLGLGPSLQALARRSPIPVQLAVDLPERPAASVETAVYYVVSEALTNAIKHSYASQIEVTITSGETLEASIVDDGVGDADPGDGSGLIGLLDRVDALGGRFELASPPGGGTRISIELPLAPATVV